MNSTWLDDSVLSSGQGTWSEWVFPRTTMHSLEDYMLEAAQEAAKTAKPDQGSKRRRITGRRSSGDNARNNDNKEASASNGTADLHVADLPHPSQQAAAAKDQTRYEDGPRASSSSCIQRAYMVL